MPRRSSGEKARLELMANTINKARPAIRLTMAIMPERVADLPDTAALMATPPWLSASTRPTNATTMDPS